MDLGLHGKRALITGGSRGIGFAVARALAAEGAAVGLIARDGEGLAAAAEGLAGQAAPAAVDSTDSAASASVPMIATFLRDRCRLMRCGFMQAPVRGWRAIACKKR